jgi:hypothetical protein
VCADLLPHRIALSGAKRPQMHDAERVHRHKDENRPDADPADRIAGQVLGSRGQRPDVFTEVEISFYLLRRPLGVKTHRHGRQGACIAGARGARGALDAGDARGALGAGGAEGC